MKTFEDLVSENKKDILKNEEEMSKLEQKIEQKHMETKNEKIN